MSAESLSGPLQDIRVVELGQLIAGPFCGQLMGDLGAEVIKVEPPGVGDPMREWGQGIPVWWSVIARNKKSITLNLREKEGQALLKRLVAQADVVIENFRPGTMEKWGLDYPTLAASNPGLVMVRVSGFGQTGPYARRAGYGSIGEAMGGIRYLAGDPDRPPSRVGLSIGDSLAATFACVGALAALHSRETTGRGQVVDSAIYEAVLAMMESTVPEYTEGGTIRERSGAILPKIAPSNVYPTSGGEMVVMGANQDSVFARLCQAMGRETLAVDERFRDHAARGEHQAELDALIGQWSAGYSATALLEILENHSVPAGRIYRVPEMLNDPQYVAREAIVAVAHQRFKNLKMQNVVPRLSETPGGIRWAGPELGEHNKDVLQGLLGMNDAELADLTERGIV
ncbi:MAG: CaiB/BaiF CoA-transferase family protein [Gammaproteobacteria bacterium]|nr:CaiB/BaiF CoA-transferase family protein [Gammaproteobacteria bacterium]